MASPAAVGAGGSCTSQPPRHLLQAASAVLGAWGRRACNAYSFTSSGVGPHSVARLCRLESCAGCTPSPPPCTLHAPSQTARVTSDGPRWSLRRRRTPRFATPNPAPGAVVATTCPRYRCIASLVLSSSPALPSLCTTSLASWPASLPSIRRPRRSGRLTRLAD